MSKINKRFDGTKKSPDYESLKKILSSCGPYENLELLLGRLFQKAPDLIREIETKLTGLSITAKKRMMIEGILEKIALMVDDKYTAKRFGMPSDISNYLAYSDLVVSRMKSSSKQWFTYLLKDYPNTTETEVTIDEEGMLLRTKLKKELKQVGLAAAVQTEVDQEKKRIWFRVTYTKRSGNKEKDKNQLNKGRPILVIYYPGEPYFYSTPKVTDVLGAAIAACLKCGNFLSQPLTGRCVDSLRKLRLGRDGRDGPTHKAVINTDRFAIVSTGVEEISRSEDTSVQKHPQLNKVTVSSNTKPIGYTEELNMTLEVFGINVIPGVHDLVKTDIFDRNPPRWISNLATAGRNEFRLKEGGRAAGRDVDLESMLSGIGYESIMTDM